MALCLLAASLAVGAPTASADLASSLPSPTADVATTSTGVSVPSGYSHRFVETFDSTSWWQAWGLGSAPQRTGIIAGNGASVLGVRVNKGTHDGTSWLFPTGAADDVHLQFRIRLPRSWDVSKTASNFKMPGFGSPQRTPLGVCTSACGGLPSDGIRSYSARTDVTADGRSGWYVYHALMPKTIPSFGLGLRWWGRTEPLAREQWYTIDLRIRMNTPGVNDGILQAWVDGTNVSDLRGLTFRLVDTLHVGNAWFDFYFGGSGVAPETMVLWVDDVVVEW